MCAYTYFNGNYYCATNTQVNNCDTYILDKKGIEWFKEHYNGKPYKIIYIDVPEQICRLRMIQRGDTMESANERIENDRVEFEGIEKMADFIVDNNYFNSCVCDIWEFMCKCEKENAERK